MIIIDCNAPEGNIFAIFGRLKKEVGLTSEQIEELKNYRYDEILDKLKEMFPGQVEFINK